MVKVGQYYRHKNDGDVWKVTRSIYIDGDSQGVCIEHGRCNYEIGYISSWNFRSPEWELITYKSEGFQRLYDKLSS